MRERITIRLCSSFLWIYFSRILYLSDLFYQQDFPVMLFYFLTSILITLFLEAFHYLIVDIIKYSYLIISVIVIFSILILYINFSYYYFVVIIYVDMVMIKELIQSYRMYKSLQRFKANM